MNLQDCPNGYYAKDSTSNPKGDCVTSSDCGAGYYWDDLTRKCVTSCSDG